MEGRRGFTVFEIVVALGIVVVLAGVLFVVIGRLRCGSEVELQRADFAVIEAGLEAYHADFGDYPRNIHLPSWNTQQDGPTPAPVFYSLAAALLGPGPAVSGPVNGVLEAGDGADGFGFRSESAVSISGSASGNTGDRAVVVVVDDADAQKVKELVARSEQAASVSFLGNAKQPYWENVGISAASVVKNSDAAETNPLPTVPELKEDRGRGKDKASGGVRLRLTLVGSLAYPHDGRCQIGVAAGKVWGPYVLPERFHLAIVPPVDSFGSPFFGYGQFVMLDRWGQVIEYFPRYRSAGGARPLFGFCQEKSVDSTNGEGAMFDWRDGAPFFTVLGQSGPAQGWPNPSFGSANAFRPELAVEWMVKDFDGPYFLISVGPMGLERPNGGFCNFANPADDNNSFSDSDLAGIFAESGNMYSFERK